MFDNISYPSDLLWQAHEKANYYRWSLRKASKAPTQRTLVGIICLLCVDQGRVLLWLRLLGTSELPSQNGRLHLHPATQYYELSRLRDRVNDYVDSLWA